MIWSVSTLSIGSGASRLVNVVNLFISLLLQQRSDIRYNAGNGRGGGCKRTGKERSSALPLPAFEVPVAGGDAVFAGLQLIAVHGDTHGAAGLPPVRSRLFEDAVQTLCLRLLFNLLRARNDHYPNPRVYFSSLEDLCGCAKVGD